VKGGADFLVVDCRAVVRISMFYDLILATTDATRKISKIPYLSDVLIVVSDWTSRTYGAQCFIFRFSQGISAIQSHISDWACDSGRFDGVISREYIKAMASHNCIT